MTNLSMKRLYGLAYDGISEEEPQGLSHEAAHRWKHEAGKASSDPSDP